MITSILFYSALVLLVIFVVVPLLMVAIYCELGMKRRSNSTPRHITKTGETFQERKSYHERGELSPGERALARAIRDLHKEGKGTG